MIDVSPGVLNTFALSVLCKDTVLFTSKRAKEELE
jgi:hypothetical protein